MSTLADILALERTAQDSWATGVFDSDNDHIFGGQLLAQSLMACGLTVPGVLAPQSLHALFLSAGSSAAPVRIDVDRLHDDEVRAVRRCRVVQGDRVVLTMLASFAVQIPGLSLQGSVSPSVEVPGDMSVRYEHPVSQDIEIVDAAPHPGRAHPSRNWARVRPALGSDPLLQACALAYLSDFYTGLVQFAEFPIDPPVTSIDHALWFHRPFDAHEWLLFDWTGHMLTSGRGHYSGHVFDAHGVMVATASQEMVARLPRP